MRQHILALEVKAGREFGVMDIGKTVDFNPETRLFEVTEKGGYAVIAYRSPQRITVDFTPLRQQVPMEVELETVEDLLKFFDNREHAKKVLKQVEKALCP